MRPWIWVGFLSAMEREAIRGLAWPRVGMAGGEREADRSADDTPHASCNYTASALRLHCITNEAGKEGLQYQLCCYMFN